jgi:DNA-binding PadR family transcriptional regulator
MFRYIVLGLLRQGGSHHGYALMKAYRARSGVQMSTGTFYRELQHLVDEGLVRVVARAPDVDARRTPYEITPTGCDVFDRWLMRPPLVTMSSDDEITARTMFLPEAPIDVGRAMTDAWKEELWLLGKRLERARQNEIHRCATQGEPFSILPLLLGRRLRHLAGDVEYLDELRASLEDLAAARNAVSADVPGARPERPPAGAERVAERPEARPARVRAGALRRHS